MRKTATLSLAAIGVVFGDIGTSPLYALNQCFQDVQTQRIDAATVMGILSLIFWALILVVCVKYATFIMRADHDGEGGTLAMLALVHSKAPNKEPGYPGPLTLLVLFGSALLYGDGVITPSISVLSAVEGIQVASPNLKELVVPISLAILVGLFLLQRNGSGVVGRFFGPIMTLWFVANAVLGIGGIIQAPQVLSALNPGDGVMFLVHHQWNGLLVLGGVVLVLSGAEALFADLGHFGRAPIVLAWYCVVLPSLLLNYFGQGAVVLLHPEMARQPYFALVPHSLLYPFVLLATLATVIASQALISAVFSLTQQAIHMGYFPRFEVAHTSKEEEGQIYIPTINYMLLAACLIIVITFRSSDSLGNAYGLAVIGTMTITSITYFFVLTRVWKWPVYGAVMLVGCFLIMDCAFLVGNIAKVLSGAWVPLVIAGLMFAIFWTWTIGRVTYHHALVSWSMLISDFTKELSTWKERRAGTAVFLTGHPNSIPLVGKNHWLRSHARYEQILLLTIVEANVPYCDPEKTLSIEEIAPHFWRITASFGFMQHPDVSEVLKCDRCAKLTMEEDTLVCFLPEPTFIKKDGRLNRLVLNIYELLVHNSVSSADYFRIPPWQIIHVGVQLEA